MSKPWTTQFDPSGQPVSREHEEHTVSYLKLWWQIFHSDVMPKLSGDLVREREK